MKGGRDVGNQKGAKRDKKGRRKLGIKGEGKEGRQVDSKNCR